MVRTEPRARPGLKKAVSESVPEAAQNSGVQGLGNLGEWGRRRLATHPLILQVLIVPTLCQETLY